MTTPLITAGDDWEFRITVYQPDGAPYDLSGNPPISWVMTDRSGIHVLHTQDVTISVTDAPAGKLSVFVPPDKSSPLNGSYTQSLRVVVGGVTHTPLRASVEVLPDPFREAVPLGAVVAFAGRRSTSKPMIA